MEALDHHRRGLGLAQQAVELADSRPASEGPAAVALLAEAVTAFERALAIAPNDPRHWFQLGGARFQLIDLEPGTSAAPAVAAYTRVIELMGSTARPQQLTAQERTMLARTYFKRGLLAVTDESVPLDRVWSDFREATLLSIPPARPPRAEPAATEAPRWPEILGRDVRVGAVGEEAAEALEVLMGKASHLAAQVAHLQQAGSWAADAWDALLPALRTVCDTAAWVLSDGGSGGAPAPASVEALWLALDRREGAAAARGAVFGAWDRLLHHPALREPEPWAEAARGAGGGACGGAPCLSAGTDWAAVQAAYARERVAVVDGLLSPAALGALRQLARDATVWHDGKLGYVGARLNTGLVSAELLGVARELSAALPHVVCGRRLRSAWAFKFEQAQGGEEAPAAPGDNLSGVGLHADAAAVNLNLWVSADGASADDARGGMAVHTREPPDSWTFEDFQDPRKIRRLLGAAGEGEVRTIAHRPNRLVLFKSNLFHETDRGAFRPGYDNRRINFTFLFGRRGQPCPTDDEDRSSVQGSAGTGSRSAAHRDEL